MSLYEESLIKIDFLKWHWVQKYSDGGGILDWFCKLLKNEKLLILNTLFKWSLRQSFPTTCEGSANMFGGQGD